ncbi:hypothetical protein PMIN03_007697 [Paraphaeosphaeria minitans]|uniref:Uncharacterized protein n=1 Tax=Paraphaeosphaeria minitans TaxID=565426 RepID=A0A9P6KSD4_9PLEO|nr:hypothetical protein PMIN01_04931 [Paraphaeosphaeria minitans]
MSAGTHKLAYAIVRAGASISGSFQILCVHTSLEKAHLAITKFATSSDFTSMDTPVPTQLRELDNSIPDWWKGYYLFEGIASVGRVYIERVTLED